jgi:hypothetical protein
MKYFYSSILLLIIAFHSFGWIAFTQYQRMSIKIQNQNIENTFSRKSKTIIVDKSTFNSNEKELEIEGVLYDIVSKTEHNTSYTLTVFEDTEESSWNQKMAWLFDETDHPDDTHSFSKIFNTEAVCISISNFVFNKSNFDLAYHHLMNAKNKIIFLANNSPPPEIMIT